MWRPNQSVVQVPDLAPVSKGLQKWNLLQKLGSKKGKKVRVQALRWKRPSAVGDECISSRRSDLFKLSHHLLLYNYNGGKNQQGCAFALSVQLQKLRFTGLNETKAGLVLADVMSLLGCELFSRTIITRLCLALSTKLNIVSKTEKTLCMCEVCHNWKWEKKNLVKGVLNLRIDFTINLNELQFSSLKFLACFWSDKFVSVFIWEQNWSVTGISVFSVMCLNVFMCVCAWVCDCVGVLSFSPLQFTAIWLADLLPCSYANAS